MCLQAKFVMLKLDSMLVGRWYDLVCHVLFCIGSKLIGQINQRKGRTKKERKGGKGEQKGSVWGCGDGR